MSQLFAVWMTPVFKDKMKISGIIKELAKKNSAPVFEPFVTLYLGSSSTQDDLKHLVGRASQDVKPLKLKVKGIRCNEEIHQSLVIEFEEDQSIGAVPSNLANTLSSSQPYELKPHMNLLHKVLPEEEKAAIVEGLNLGLTEVSFEQIAVMKAKDDAIGLDDVKNWSLSFRRTLGQKESSSLNVQF